MAGRKENAYSAYGFDGGGDSSLGYNGELRNNPTGHYFLGRGYRMFNTQLMRFQSPDGAEWSPFGIAGFNSYDYVDADPINNGDPSGHINFKFWTWFKTKPSSASGAKVSANASNVKPEPLVRITREHVDTLKSLQEYAGQKRIKHELESFEVANKLGFDGFRQGENFLQSSKHPAAVSYRESVLAVQKLEHEISGLSKNLGQKGITQSRALELRKIGNNVYGQKQAAFSDWKRMNLKEEAPWMLRNQPLRDKWS
ncbi:RHS repeat-associated core domain-containing protein [Pseudomonas sp. GB2N2]